MIDLYPLSSLRLNAADFLQISSRIFFEVPWEPQY